MAESSITHCPAAALADMAQHLVNLRLALDSRPSETEPEAAAEVSRAVDVIEERLNATLEFAAHVEARSAKGALFQVVAMADMTYALSGCVTPPDAAEAQRFENAMRRLAHSVAAYLESTNDGLRLEDVAGAWFLSRNNSPQRSIDFATTVAELAERSPA